MRTTVLSVTFALFAQAGLAAEFTLGDLVVTDPLVTATAPTANTAAGYLTITNTGDTADMLMSVEAPFTRVEIHSVKVENDVASMFPIDSVEIAPGESITLTPGAEHVMFMGLNGDQLEVGETIEAVLTFATAGALDVVFDVETRETIGAHEAHARYGHDGTHGGGHGDHN